MDAMTRTHRPGFPPPEPPGPSSAYLVDVDDFAFVDQDGAQAALQPAISSAASHLTSCQTPAAEKAAALDAGPGRGFFDGAIAETEAQGDGDSDSEPASSDVDAPARRRPPPPDQLPRPMTWVPTPEAGRATMDKQARSSQTRGVLGAAFAPTRERRSRSAGQDALRRLQKAFPSLTMPTHLLPSLPISFLSSFTGDQKHAQARANRAKPTAMTADAPPPARLLPQAATRPLTGIRRPPSRPPVLRRVTSDDSILYHSLSRASSLGDDDRFHDVREMVNIRFMALRDSLPDVPNFKMPGLARLQAASRMSSIFVSSSTDDSFGSRAADVDQDPAASPKDNALDGVLEGLTGDIVVLGGYRGSVLRSAEPPHQQLWAPVKLGFNMRKANLEVGLDDDDEAAMDKRIIPSGMLKHIGPIDISRKLFKRLRSCDNARSGKLRVWDYGYDWRLSPALSSRRLREFLAGLPSNAPGVAPESRGAVVIAHSLGGLITRHAVNQRPDLFAGVLYAGVPQRCINILGPFRNGDAVLFNEKLLTAQVNFSIRTSFVLLPDDGFCFVDKDTGEEYPVDFLDADDWVRWRLSPCVAPALPPHNRDRQPAASPLSALFPNSLLKSSRSDKRTLLEAPDSPHGHEPRQGMVSGTAAHRDGTLAPQLDSAPPAPPPSPPAPDRDRYMAYLRRTLAATRQFRAELAHSPALEAANAYPPHAVLYGKSIPTVYAAQVQGREAIACADAYDDLLFRPGDGVVLAREAMLPPGYALVRAGRVSTERGHLTMLGDVPAMGRALQALVRGRRKGIGLGLGLGTGGSGSGSGSGCGCGRAATAGMAG